MNSRFTTKELADMKLPGYPGTAQGWDKLVKARSWEFTVGHGRGRGGVRREYSPSPDVLALIETRQRGEQPATPTRPLVIEQPSNMVGGVRKHYSLSPNTSALFEQQAAVWGEPAIRLAFIVRGKSQFAKASEGMLQRVTLLAFRFVFLFCDGDVQRINQWLNDSRKTDGLVQMAYEGDCMKRGITPGSDLNPGPDDPQNLFF